MVLAKKWILSKYFDGKPKPSDITMKTEELPETLKDGGNIYIFCSNLIIKKKQLRLKDKFPKT